jgi:hypothetical protein
MKAYRLVLAASLAAALAGCGSSGGGTAPVNLGDPGTGGGGKGSGANECGSSEPGLCTTIEITGAVTVHGSFDVSMTSDQGLLESCAEYVKGEQGKSRLTLPVALGQEVDGHTVGIANRISKSYQGPRTYQDKELGAVDGGLHVDVDAKSYQRREGSSAQAEIRADGSGSLTFGNLREATNSSDDGPKGVISGSYRWTCHD